eukprot:5205427-Pyramimonas_sp.AAC.1
MLIPSAELPGLAFRRDSGSSRRNNNGESRLNPRDGVVQTVPDFQAVVFQRGTPFSDKEYMDGAYAEKTWERLVQRP